MWNFSGTELRSIGGYAFAANPLTNITIPAKVTAIGQYVFKDLQSLPAVVFESGRAADH
jgi:hypothetical protein